MKTEQRVSVGHTSTLSERAKPISANDIDATVTDAEIEAFFNEEAAALV